MSNINQLSITMEAASSQGEVGSLGIENKQAWLRVLEKADLLNALRETLVIEAEVAKGSKPPLGSDVAILKKIPSPREDTNVGTLQLRRTVRNGQISELDIKPESPKPSKQAGEVETLRGALGASGGLVNDINEDLKVEASAKSPLSLLTPDAAKWASRNIVILRSGTSIELWVRDSNMTGDKLIDLLKGMRQNMGGLGASLSKVVLNGQEIFFLKQSSEPKKYFNEV